VQEAVRELAQPVMDAAALASGVHVELSMGSTRVVASRILNDGGWLHTGLQNRKRLGEKNLVLYVQGDSYTPPIRSDFGFCFDSEDVQIFFKKIYILKLVQILKYVHILKYV
jgi:hypothetical protein